jgi:hypothetical protein
MSNVPSNSKSPSPPLSPGVLGAVVIPRRGSDPVTLLLLGILAVVFLAFYLQVAHRTRPSQNHFGDFRHFYYAARALLDHTDLYTSGTGGYLYPPLIAFTYTPVARLAYRHAALVMLAINVLLDFAGVLLTARAFADRFHLAPRGTTGSARLIAAAALLGVLLNFDKVHSELQMFQTNALMFFLFALSLYWLDRRPVLAGIPLGFILNIKYLSLAMFPWLLLRRRWKTAGAFAASSVFFALLPAVISGWHSNLHDLAVAYGGLLHMLGVGGGTAAAGHEQANVEDIAAGFSCSITSAMARLTRLGWTLKQALAAAAVIALAVAAIVAAMYRRLTLPLLSWPPADSQRTQPYSTLVGLEFTALVVATLAFSPQTNTRHLLLALLVTIPSSLLILRTRGQAQWTLIAGMLIELAGFTLPWGHSTATSGDKSPSLPWLAVAGPSWCMLIALFTLLSAGLTRATTIDESGETPTIPST